MNAILTAGLKYFLIFCLLFGILTAISLVPKVGAFCNTIYRQPTEVILKKVFRKVHLQLKADKKDADVIRIEYASKAKVEEMRRANRAGLKNNSFQIQGKIYNVKFYNAFLSFYIFFVALMLLSPLPIKDILIGVGIGTVLFYLYTVFNTYLKLLVFFNQSEDPIYQTSEFILSISRGLIFIQTIGATVLVVIILWILLAFRKNNWQTLLKVK